MAFDLSTAKPVYPDQPSGSKFDLSTARPVYPDQPDEPSLGAKLLRQAGLTVRAGVRGVTALPALLSDIPANIAGTYEQAKNAVTSGSLAPFFKPVDVPYYPFPSQSQAIDQTMTKAGLPEPATKTERIAGDVAGGMAGAGSMVKGGQLLAKSGNALVQRIGDILSTAPASQVVAGGTGPGAAGATREVGGGPVAQLAAGAIGTTVPALPAAVKAAVQLVARGGEAGRQAVANNIKTFEDAGAGTPSVGQATQSRVGQAIESVLSKSPGGAGVMARKAQGQAASLGQKVDDMAARLSPQTGAEPAGRAVKSGIESFVENFKAKAGKLYDKLDKYIPSHARVDVNNTRSALETLNADIPGAPNISKLFRNARIKGIQGALESDTTGVAGIYESLPTWQKQLLDQVPEVERNAMLNGFVDGKLPYEAVKKLRTLVGQEIADGSLVSGVPRSKWTALYGALSKDLEGAAGNAGPKAQAAFTRANDYYRSGQKRIDDVLGPIFAKGDPEDVFRAAMSGTKEGATTIRGVMKSLPQESRKVMAATALKRLGIATPGRQNNLGETFSTETFLTNWNRLHPDAKRALFEPLDPQMRSDLDKIAKVASNVREGSKVFANPSGTAQGTASNMTAGGFALSVLTGHLGAAAGIAAGVGGANVAARVMTSPRLVHFLAQNIKTPIEQLPAQLNTLFQENMHMTGEERRNVREFIDAARSAYREQKKP